MSFSHFPFAVPIHKAIEYCGYTTPTPIQEETIPCILRGDDLIATARTGSGKTAAFILPALERLIKPSLKSGRGPRVLILTPTRELANQVTESAKNYGRFMQLRTGVVLGGVSYWQQEQLLSRPLDILIATPGRLIDHMVSGRIDFSRLELLVIDEADRMLDMGFSQAVERIAKATPSTRQTLLFTATWTTSVESVAIRLTCSPKRIAVDGHKPAIDQIDQWVHATDDKTHKDKVLRHVVANKAVTRAIVFTSTKWQAEQLARKLHAEGLSAESLHGDMTQSARNRTMARMRQGKLQLLVATDVASRGLDVVGISHVINYDIPKFAEDYVHRIGRTGRAGATGVAISLAGAIDRDPLNRIERYIGKPIARNIIKGLEPRKPDILSTTPSNGRNHFRGVRVRFQRGSSSWSCRPLLSCRGR